MKFPGPLKAFTRNQTKRLLARLNADEFEAHQHYNLILFDKKRGMTKTLTGFF